jgi:hypothetical protein
MLLITIFIALICIRLLMRRRLCADAAGTGNWILGLCGVGPRSDWNLCAQGHTLSGLSY